MKRVYLDSSAFVKIVVNETESAALRKWLHSRAWTTSVLSRAEVLRAVRIHGAGAVETARRMLGLGELVRISPALLDLSASLGPVELRTLDAIHLAAASLLGRDLLAVVTYDQRMAAAAQSIGMRTVSPA